MRSPLKGIILVVQIHKIVLTPNLLYPGQLFGFIFLTIFMYCYFFYVSLFIENHSIASHHIFTDVLGIIQRFTSLKKSFYSISSSVASHFEVFWEYVSLSLRAFPHLMKFCTDVYCITLTIKALRKISQLVSLCLGNHAAYFSMSSET